VSARFTALFCGAGGDITGLIEAGYELVVGANHWDRAIETVSSNYRDADFLCTDINHYDMRRLPRTEVLWASVICTELSPAGGNKKLRGQQVLDLEEQGHVPTEAYERTRACALDVIRATEVHRYKAIIVENVVEFARDWELYDWWIEGMKHLGYNVQVVNASAAHLWSEDNPPAPQWRDRIYIVFTHETVRLPDLTLRPPSWCFVCDQVVEGVQSWKRTDRRRVGKFGQQYEFRCPRTPCGQAVVEPFVLPAIAALDLTDVGERIGDRKRPLAAKTMARIEWGLREFAEPVVAQVAGNTYEAGEYKRAWPATSSPLSARQATGCDALVQPPLVVPNRERGRARPAGEEPMPTVTRSTSDLVVQPFITMARRHGTATGITDEPVATVTAGGNHHALTTPPGAFYVKNFGGNARPEHMAKPLSDPLGTVTTIDHHALVIPYRKGARPRRAADQPIPTVSTRESAGVLHPLTIDPMECFYRVLRPREHFGAQRFPLDYRVAGNIGEQTMQAGNAVPCNAAHWIGRRLAEVL
jgi:DNA (cytosine-5)-methyltransferase 1